MSKFIKKIQKAIIDNNTFIRVINLYENDNLINTLIYKKVNEKYELVFAYDLPKHIIENLFKDEIFIDLTNDELNHFKQAMCTILEDTKKNYINDEKIFKNLFIDTIFDQIYLVSKRYDTDFNLLELLLVNEYGVVKNSIKISDNEIPFICYKVIKNNHFVENKTFLIGNGLFVHFYKENDKYLGLVLTAENIIKVDDNNVKKQVLDIDIKYMFTIFDEDNDFRVVYDFNDELFLDINDKKLTKIVKEFKDIIIKDKENYKLIEEESNS